MDDNRIFIKDLMSTFIRYLDFISFMQFSHTCKEFYRYYRNHIRYQTLKLKEYIRKVTGFRNENVNIIYKVLLDIIDAKPSCIYSLFYTIWGGFDIFDVLGTDKNISNFTGIKKLDYIRLSKKRMKTTEDTINNCKALNFGAVRYDKYDKNNRIVNGILSKKDVMTPYGTCLAIIYYKVDIITEGLEKVMFGNFDKGMYGHGFSSVSPTTSKRITKYNEYKNGEFVRFVKEIYKDFILYFDKNREIRLVRRFGKDAHEIKCKQIGVFVDVFLMEIDDDNKKYYIKNMDMCHGKNLDTVKYTTVDSIIEAEIGNYVFYCGYCAVNCLKKEKKKQGIISIGACICRFCK